MEPRFFSLRFYGSGFEYFKILLVNWILCIITLGLYYPWAKAKTLKYLYSQTSFEEQPFIFTGTGNEMFKGFVKALLFIFILYAIVFATLFLGKGGMIQIIILLVYLIFIAIIPLVLHGSYRYRMAKTQWSGIRFGYNGDRSELVKLFFRDLFFTIITLGIYGAWFSMNLRTYIIGHIQMGNARFKYQGNGGDFFVLNLKGYFLTLITLGIYSFWWQKSLFNYYVDNLSLSDDGEGKMYCKSTATGGDFAALLIVNILIIVFTLGLGYAWVATRTLDFVMKHILLKGNIDFEKLVQTQTDYSDATATDMADFLDFGFIV
jgi:uncharacterized membrane protein YjgN (DUF898 family)